MEKDPQREFRRLPASLRVVLVACAGAGLLFFATQKGAMALARPQFCAGCHVMQTQYVSFLRSPHHRATCVDCHSGDRCGGCHTPRNADAGLRAKRVNAGDDSLHATHAVLKGMACASCHKDIMHARMDGRGQADLSKTCANCHKQTDSGAQPLRHGQTGHPRTEEL